MSGKNETKEETMLTETEQTQGAGKEEVDGKDDFSTKVASNKLSTGKPKKTTKVVLGTNKRTFTRIDY